MEIRFAQSDCLVADIFSSEKGRDSAIRGQNGQFIIARLPYASNEAMMNHMAVMLDELKHLQPQPNNCFRFLFPVVKGGVNANRVLTAELQRRDMAALQEVIRTSAGKESFPNLDEEHVLTSPRDSSAPRRRLHRGDRLTQKQRFNHRTSWATCFRHPLANSICSHPSRLFIYGRIIVSQRTIQRDVFDS